MTSQFSSISPTQLHQLLRNGDDYPVIDVRSAAEYRAGHIPGARLLPIEQLTPAKVKKSFQDLEPGKGGPVYLTCHAGPRAEKAAQQLQQAGFENLQLVEGGTQAWQQAGLPLNRCGNAISLERQVQIAIGALLVMKVMLGFSVHELFFALTAFIGAGLIVAGTTRWCGMAKLIAQMPWNRGTDCSQQVKI
jgi:rhodanese-related sulfurtransferase